MESVFKKKTILLLAMHLENVDDLKVPVHILLGLTGNGMELLWFIDILLKQAIKNVQHRKD